MACRYREELVGKRFISVRTSQKLKISKISEWEWRSGVVRALSCRDTSSLDLSVLIEFDDIDWTRREWVRIHDIFQLFLVEHTLVWAERPDPDKPRQSASWPGLSFRAVVDKVGLGTSKRKPVEFLVDRFLGLVEEKEIQIFQEGEENNHPTALQRSSVQQGLKAWLDYQDGQKILLTTPTVLVGYRLEVYRAEGTTQWYTAVIQSYNHTSKTLSVTDDTVLEEHQEDPTLIQMHLIDDGVVDSILRGVEIGGIAPRRRLRTVKQDTNKEPVNQTTKVPNTPSSTASTVSRTPVPRKTRTPQQSVQSASSSPVQTSGAPSPATSEPLEKKETKVTDKPVIKPRLNPKDRKRKVEVAKPANDSPISKRRSNSRCEESKPLTPTRRDESPSQTSIESTPQLRVSPRTTPSKEKVRPLRTREIDKESIDKTSDKIGHSESDLKDKKGIVKVDSETIVVKPKARSRQRREERVDSPSLRNTDSPKTRTESPRTRNDSPRGSNRVSPATQEAEAVIKSSNSGSSNKKDKKSERGLSKSEKRAVSAKGDAHPVVESPSPVSKTLSSSNNPGKDKSNILAVSEIRKTDSELVEEKLREIKSALEKGKSESKAKGVSSTVCQEKQTKPRRERQKKDKVNSETSKCVKSISEEATKKEEVTINESSDNMHFKKKKQSMLSGGTPSSTPQSSGIQSLNIDFNQSVTDQITRAEKLSTINGEEKSGSVSSALSSPLSETQSSHSERAERDSELFHNPRDNSKHNSISVNSGFHLSNTNSSWSQDERSQSRNSEDRCSSGFSDEIRRPGSRVDELRSSKSSPASSPLIVDKSEPIHIYRDPELMSKNPVKSNVPSMHNSHKTYPSSAHNAITTQITRPASVGMSTTPLTAGLERSSRTPVVPSVAYPSPLSMGHTSLPGASLSGLLPPGLHQLDPATLALHHQIAAVQQQQVAAALASQYGNALSMSYPPRSSLNSAQLEHLWQQKYPSVPVPPPWLLAKHQDDLIRDARMIHEQEQLERERLDRLDRERDLREREQRERKERERRDRERLEKERLERERREREKLEQERLERERAEREKLEKERQDRERRDRLERERSRILKESADSQAAVDQHFSESLRLASQRAAQTGMWPTPSITLGTGKPPKSEPSPNSYKSGEKMGEIKPEEKIKQEQLRETDFRYAEMMRKEFYHQQQMIQKQRMGGGEHMVKQEVKNEAMKDMKPGSFVGYPSKSPGSLGVKQETGSANFSLYGYQPEKHSYITTAQLHSYELDKIKQEKAQYGGRPQSPRKKEMPVPPPLIKDMKHHSSVIVENKMKEGLKSSSPHTHQQQYAPQHMSPHHPKPAHTPERSTDRPLPISSSPGSMPHGMPSSMAHTHHMAALKAEAARQGTSRSQSPLRIASPHQLSVAVMQPMDYRCSPNTNKTRGSPGSTGSPHSVPSSVNSTGAFTPAIAQAPVSLPHSSVAFTYSLIQQGLVPNPIYTNTSGGKNSENQRTVSVTGTAQVPRAAHSPHQGIGSGNQQQQQQSAMAQPGTKRKGPKESNGRKRQKGGEIQGASSPGSSALNLSIPVTTPQIMTNQSPYTTSSVSVSSSPPGGLNSQPGMNTSTSVSQSNMTVNNRLSGFTGFMDSFKSFVENTVQNAFLSDPELAKPKEGQNNKKQSPEQTHPVHQHQSPAPQAQHTDNYKPKSSLERSSTPVVSQPALQQNTAANVTAPGHVEESSNLSTNGNNSNSSIVESINRVANGQVDTDSDTLSAPSPPSNQKTELANPSPHKSAKHPNLKKAWLQRHSDEDKQEVKPVVVADVAPAPKQEETAEMEQIAKIETTSEAEKEKEKDKDQAADQNNLRKRVNTKKDRTNNKKIKVETEERPERPSSPSSQSGGKKKSSRTRTKDTKSKTTTETMSEEQIKKIVENCKESVKEVVQDIEKASDEVQENMNTEDAEEPPTSNLTKNEPEKSESDASKSDQGESMETDSVRRGEKKKKKMQDKKDKKLRREKIKEKEKEKPVAPPSPLDEEETEEDEPDVEVEMPASATRVLPPSILKETELKIQQSTFTKPLVREQVSVLKKTGQPFLQDDSCSEVTPKLMKCRECKMTPTQRGKTVANIFCRFYAFRRLKYSQRGFVAIDGFSELTDAEQDDIDPWIPKFPIIEPRIDVETAKFIIGRVGDKFCELIQQEQDAQTCAGENAKIAWKRAVTGVREMCDVCDTTLFNMHWVCRKCGFVVCIDCYKVKAKEEEEEEEEEEEQKEVSKENGNDVIRTWLTCSANRQPHEVDKLMLTQIIPADALWEVGRMIHEMRDRWLISRTCPCSPKTQPRKNGIKTEIVQEAIKHLSPKKKVVNGIGSEEKGKTKNGNIKNTVYNPDSSSPLSLLADVASMDSEKTRDRSESPFQKKEGKSSKQQQGKSYTPITEPVSPGSSEKKAPPSCSTLRELLTKTAGKLKNNSETSKKKSKNSNSSLNEIIKIQEENQIPKEMEKMSNDLNQPTFDSMKLEHYTPRLGASHTLVRETPIKIHNLTETSVLYPDVPHSWLCDGRLLRLHDPRHKGNLKIFMEQWKRGQPVLVSGMDKYVNQDLWKPEYFSKQFGELENDLINCRTSCMVVGQPMKHFWDGFGCLEERLVDENGMPMLLKLKDWPPSDDFSDVLPQQFNDLMNNLPLPEYTRRDGRLNLVSRLPDFLVKPDLGPKMYIAYGSAQYPKEGTTNLHLDVSDAANLMVYVGYLEDDQHGRVEKDEEALKAIDMARCDSITKRRIREVRETPGALWHIFDACDADKMRDFLNKVGKERGEEVEQHHDPIHDQSWYLDEKLRERLSREYGVLPYTIIQCLGDAIFIPAGAPHQVRNLNNCIKVAEDFVSPENIQHCFHLTQEFRHLSEGHSNHEDKLQVKNIIYHAVKDAVAVLNENSPEDYED